METAAEVIVLKPGENFQEIIRNPNAVILVAHAVSGFWVYCNSKVCDNVHEKLKENPSFEDRSSKTVRRGFWDGTIASFKNALAA